MDEATLFDIFFHYLREIGVFALLENLDPQTQERQNLLFLQLATTLIGVPGLLSCDWFNPEGSEANATKKDYEPIPLNAVVVTWNNQTPPVDKQVVFVTNREVKDPFVAFDHYYDDRRSESICRPIPIFSLYRNSSPAHYI
jgi:hypothetical protein